MLLRLGLEVADRLINALPAGMAYRLADLAGDAWRRFAPPRRRLVAANLVRVCTATGRPTSGPAFHRLVRDVFRNHARYYLEVLRAPRYPVDRIDEIVEVTAWPEFEPVLRSGPSILVSWHIGNPEPFASFLAGHGLRPLTPIEVIEPRALYEFLTARRGAGHPELIPVDRSVRPLTRRLRDGGLVAIVADRDLAGDGQPVTIFGHPTTLPTGPATLALTHRAGLLAGCCLRTAPDRYAAIGELIPLPATGDRRADIAALTDLLARRLEHDIAAAPDQWWGSFQPFWPDLDPESGP
jgi:phosphatidylinositol dimannoside acyltransferase